jgi:hypothetical protein
MNHIIPVKEIEKRVSTGFPEGADVISTKQIPILLERIRELEAALAPFARIGVTLTSETPPLVDCYAKDCANAYEMLNEAASIRPAPIAYEIPATY